MLGAFCSRAGDSSEWLIPAVASLASCLITFVAGPKLVPGLLRPYASLTYKSAKDKDSSGGRYVAFLHAVVVSILNIYILIGTDTFQDPDRASLLKGAPTLMQQKSRLSNVSLGISLGYFLIDAVIVAWYMPAMGGVEMVTHHVAAFLSVFVTVWYREAHMYTLALLATEATTPFINFRWLLEKMGWKETQWYKANGVALLISWILVRIVMFFWFFTHLHHRREQIFSCHWPVGVLLLTVPPLLSFLNLMWFEKIVRGIVKVFFQNGHKCRAPLHDSATIPVAFSLCAAAA